MVKEYSPEVIALRDRVKLGNQKLNYAWEQIKQLDHDTKEWSEKVEEWRQANERLSLLASQLTLMSFTDCLYRDKSGNKTRKCLEGMGCRVCTSDYPHWQGELMDLPSPSSKP